ncbi:DUF169 domain-containing protein [Plebeiibacterium marinum]|uniref:DUF169 domain-containing protein n=1 Tax=Plebeiibacterium marinum TaxID=2992111 RepID=A0AAE3MBC5_9BACT|nr:DUF169 domain-containing protein [Plebeiobacterium marinum]MCW3803987.1 DUF169 domain-containing protein [Plebeiobacterium marinum]
MATLLDANYLMDKLGIDIPLIAVYDAPHDAPFDNVIEPVSFKRICMFAYYNAWLRGQTLKLTSTNYGCGGCGYWIFGKESREPHEFVEFLCDEEGLKCSHEVTKNWLDVCLPYKSKHKCIYIGTIKNSMAAYLKSVTFFVNADQLSALVIGANYFSDSVKSTVSVPFGSGCMQILTLVNQSEEPMALIGATDLAMRKYLPKNIMAFTVNPAMFEKLCSLDDESFLTKPFLKDLLDFRKSTK